MCCVVKERPGCRWLAPDLEGPWPADMLIPKQVNKEVISPIRTVGETPSDPGQARAYIYDCNSVCTKKSNFYSILTKPWESLMHSHLSREQQQVLKCQGGNDQPMAELQPELCIKHSVTCEGI